MKNQTTFNRVTGADAYSIWFGKNEGDATFFDEMMEVDVCRQQNPESGLFEDLQIGFLLGHQMCI